MLLRLRLLDFSFFRIRSYGSKNTEHGSASNLFNAQCRQVENCFTLCEQLSVLRVNKRPTDRRLLFFIRYFSPSNFYVLKDFPWTSKFFGKSIIFFSQEIFHIFPFQPTQTVSLHQTRNATKISHCTLRTLFFAQVGFENLKCAIGGKIIFLSN